MNIKGDITILRACEPEDFGLFKRIYENAEVRGLQVYGTIYDLNMNIEDWNRSLKENMSYFQLTIAAKDDVELGFLQFNNIDWKNGSIQLDFAVDPDHDNRGYVKDALVTAAKFVFNHMRFETVVIYCLDHDAEKKLLLEEIGFIQDALLRSRILIEEKRYDIALYTLLFNDLKHYGEDNDII